MTKVAWDKDVLLIILNDVDDEIDEYPQQDIAEIADKLQEVLEDIRVYLLKKMNKSILVKQIANTKFSELSEETLEELFHIINRKEEPKEVCPKCYYSKLAYYSSLQYKSCTKCGFKIDWKLKPDQTPLIKHQR